MSIYCCTWLPNVHIKQLPNAYFRWQRVSTADYTKWLISYEFVGPTERARTPPGQHAHYFQTEMFYLFDQMARLSFYYGHLSSMRLTQTGRREWEEKQPLSKNEWHFTWYQYGIHAAHRGCGKFTWNILCVNGFFSLRFS